MGRGGQLVTLLRLTANSDELAADIENLAEWIQGVSYGKADEAMSEIATMLAGSVRDTMLAQDFVPNSEVTTAYKQRKGLDPRVMFATGNTFARIDPRHGSTWARVYRGWEEWFAFLHDKGVGVAHWSREGTERARAGKTRRHRDRKQFSEGRIPLTHMGLTRFPKRPIFVLRPEVESAILERWERFLQSACDEVNSGAA
jgi:phage gpG-like protein